MKFRDYCLVIMGDKKNTLSEIIKISESKPSYLDAKGLMILTFTSIMGVEEITDYLKNGNVNFLIFDLDKSKSGVNFIKPEINDGLFGFINNDDRNNFLNEKSQLLQHEIEYTSGSTGTFVNQESSTLNIDDIQNLTLEERDYWIDTIINKGVNNLSDYDKKLLNNLSND